MTYEETKRKIEVYCEYMCACDLDHCNNCENKVAIEALEKQSNIVHCKDCQSWKTIAIETLDGRTTEAGQCELTKWLCGGQGYCMYGRKAE